MAPPRRAVTQHASNNGPLRAHNSADFKRPLFGSITTLFLHRAFFAFALGLASKCVWPGSSCGILSPRGRIRRRCKNCVIEWQMFVGHSSVILMEPMAIATCMRKQPTDASMHPEPTPTTQRTGDKSAADALR